MTSFGISVLIPLLLHASPILAEGGLSCTLFRNCSACLGSGCDWDLRSSSCAANVSSEARVPHLSNCSCVDSRDVNCQKCFELGCSWCSSTQSCALAQTPCAVSLSVTSCPLCSIRDICDSCIESPFCGWCMSHNHCEEGNKNQSFAQGSECALSAETWVFSGDKCPTGVLALVGIIFGSIVGLLVVVFVIVYVVVKRRQRSRMSDAGQLRTYFTFDSESGQLRTTVLKEQGHEALPAT